MSYSNGIGNLQQVHGSITSATTQPATQAVETANAPKRHEASSARASQSDQATLSSASGMIAHALEGSDVRADKVAALQQAIASGSYHVSSSQVAGKMIDSLLE